MIPAAKLIDSPITRWLFGEPSQVYFSTPQVHEWAEKAMKSSSEEQLTAIREDVRNQKLRCGRMEKGLNSCFKFISKHQKRNFPGVDPIQSCSPFILALSECLNRRGRQSGTNPDVIS